MLEVLACRQIAAEHSVQQLKVTLNFVSKSRAHLSVLSAHADSFFSLDPGWCHSELMREVTNPVVNLLKRLLCRTTEVGSRTIAHAGYAGPETHGKYLSDCQITPCANLVEGQGGAEMQRRVWQELAAKLNEIQPGLTKNLDA